MSQHDFNIANQGFPATRADINNAFAALASTSSGASAPSTTFANQFWYDTANNLLMFRNEADSAWITLAYLDQATNEWEIRSAVIQAVDSAGVIIKTDDGTSRITVADDGTVTIANALTVSGNLSVDGGTIKLDGNYPTGTQNVALGDAALDSITTGKWNVALGHAALTTATSSSQQTAIGRLALTTSNGSDNTAVGFNAANANTSGTSNTAIGAQALNSNTTASNNTAVGYQAGYSNTTGQYNHYQGYQTGYTNATGTHNVAMGHVSLYYNTGSYNTALGGSALANNTTASSNTAVGYQAGYSNTTGGGNSSLGFYALRANTTGINNTATGRYSLTNCTGGGNTALGDQTGYNVTSGSNLLFLGKDAGITGSPGGNYTSESNHIVLGDENIVEAHIQVDWSVASDQRDKTDFTALDLGLDFVKALAPVTYKWDKRSKYGDKYADDYDLNAQTPDGTHKEDWLDIGFKAQEVQALEEAAGYATAAKRNLTVSTSGDGKQMGIQYNKFVPILVKAIQELSAKNDDLEARITALEGA